MANHDSQMVITCLYCHKQYRVDRAKLQSTVRKAHCKACGATFPLPLEDESASRQPEAWSEATPAGKRTPRRLAISLNKVGMGKTSTAVTLAAGLAAAGFKVLLVDADPHGQAAPYLGVKPPGGLAEAINGTMSPEAAMVQARENLWLLAGGKALAGLECFAAGRATQSVQIVDRTLAPLEKGFAYVLVDTSPEWDPLTVSVLFYVRELLIPVSMEVMSVQGFGEFLQLVDPIDKLVDGRRLKYILPTFYDPRVKKAVDIHEKFVHVYGDLVCAPIYYSGQLKEYTAVGKTVFDLGTDSKCLQDYEALVKKVVNDT